MPYEVEAQNRATTENGWEEDWTDWWQGYWSDAPDAPAAESPGDAWRESAHEFDFSGES